MPRSCFLRAGEQQIPYSLRVQRLILALLSFFCLLLSSCIEGEEEIWINADGSGKLRVHYTMPPAAVNFLGDPATFLEAIEEIDEKEERLKVQALSFEEENGVLIFHLEATFDSILELEEIATRNEDTVAKKTGSDPKTLDSIAGVIDFKLDGMTPDIKRTISLGSVFPNSVKQFPGALGQSNFKYTIHLPMAVKETNAHEVSDDRKTVAWKFMLREHTNEPIVMKLRTKLPIPWWVWVGLALIIALIAFWLRRKFRR